MEGMRISGCEMLFYFAELRASVSRAEVTQDSLSSANRYGCRQTSGPLEGPGSGRSNKIGEEIF